LNAIGQIGRRTETVMQAIRGRVASRTLVAGDRLPSIRALAAETGVSPSTVVEAYDRLVAEGVIRARRGSGFYDCATALPPLALGQEIAPQERDIDPFWVSRQSLDADPLALKPGCGWLPADWMPVGAIRKGMRALARGGDSAAQEPAIETPQPRVVYLSNAAITSPWLPAWLDQLEAAVEPVILCVGPPATAAPQAGQAKAQHHIDLLAIEQNAWMLSARDPRCVVVGSRTELDWAMKNGQLSIWAPSRIVLDAVDGPAAAPSDAPALAAWFAVSSGATELVLIGAELPESVELPTRVLSVDSAETV